MKNKALYSVFSFILFLVLGIIGNEALAQTTKSEGVKTNRNIRKAEIIYSGTVTEVANTHVFKVAVDTIYHSKSIERAGVVFVNTIVVFDRAQKFGVGDQIVVYGRPGDITQLINLSILPGVPAYAPGYVYYNTGASHEGELSKIEKRKLGKGQPWGEYISKYYNR